MSFFYDRDQNITGTNIPATLVYNPSYGATVSFSSELALYNTVDNYIYSMPKGLNHLQMEITMPFENRKQEEARQIAGFFENLQGTGFFQYTDPAQIYKPINLFASSIDNQFVENDIFSLSVRLHSDQASPILAWDNPFLTGSNLKGDWSSAGVAYKKYDVVKYTVGNTANLYDSFYYCTGDHTSASPITNGKWTRELDFQPTYTTQLTKETSVLKTEFPYSFTKRTNFGSHANVLKNFKLDFKGISDAETRCLLHFLIGRQGYRKFQYKLPKIYNQFKYFFAPEWQHTFVYKNVNDVSVTLVEDPIGIRRVY